MVPDHRIVKMVKRYDPKLFFQWNHKEEFFELWMKHWQGGAVKITPVTQSIYEAGAPRAFAPLDERILFWIYEADSTTSSKHDYISTMKAYDEFIARRRASAKDDYLHLAKEMWHANNNFYSTRSPVKNGPPKFENYVKQKFIRPTQRSLTSNRIYRRGKVGANLYNYRRRG